MKLMKKVISIILLLSLIMTVLSCGDQTGNKTGGDTTDAGTTAEETTAKDMSGVCEIPDDVRFDGETFTFAIYENANTNNHMVTDEENGDTQNDAMYKRQRMTEERFGITLQEVVYDDNASKFRAPILSGDSDYNIANVRCTDALSFWQEGIIIPTSELPYIDLEKTYWNKDFNESLTLVGQQYIAIGDMLTSTLDLTYALTFNKKLAEDYNVGDIYALVRDGKWTYDAMLSMMKLVTTDLNGDTKMDENDCYGYAAHPKQVLPDFWISAGEMVIKKDADGIPYLAVGEERFIDVFNKIFDITYGAETYYKPSDALFDVPESCIKLFSNNQSLFMDASFYYIQQLRSMETDFGIIPYPKFDEEQERYYSRVSYYNAPIVPVTNQNAEFTGALLEYFNYASSLTVIPAYRDTVLYGKVIRDEESSDMLDIIFDARVVDIGDTTLCGEIRDGTFSVMFSNENNNLSSKIPNMQTVVDKFVSKLPE